MVVSRHLLQKVYIGIIAAAGLALLPEQLAAQTGSAEPAPFDMDVFLARRAALMDSIGEGTAVLYSKGRHTETGYRADGNFWYLTGIDEAGAILVLAPGERDAQMMFLPTRDTEAERWTGAHPALSESLMTAWGMDRIKRTGRLNRTIVSHMKHSPTLHLISNLVSPASPVPTDLEFYEKVSGRIPGVSIENSSRFIETMRMTKTDDEIANLVKAIEITHAGLTSLLAAIKPGVTEFYLDGVMEQSFKAQGAQHMAFDPIVGAGEMGAVLHYERKNQPLKSGQLLLLDVGAQWNRYNADISRTVPVDGKFTDEQAIIYDIVLNAQEAAIKAIKPGVTVAEVHEVAKSVIRKAGYGEDFIHGTSHFLGLNTHDVGDYAIPLAPGMVITVEPGIYLPDRKIGIRIEDDVLVTKNGYRVLSSDIPKTRADVEAWMAQAGQSK